MRRVARWLGSRAVRRCTSRAFSCSMRFKRSLISVRSCESRSALSFCASASSFQTFAVFVRSPARTTTAAAKAAPMLPARDIISVVVIKSPCMGEHEKGPQAGFLGPLVFCRSESGHTEVSPVGLVQRVNHGTSREMDVPSSVFGVV